MWNLLIWKGLSVFSSCALSLFHKTILFQLCWLLCYFLNISDTFLLLSLNTCSPSPTLPANHLLHPKKSLRFLVGLTKLGSRKGESKNNNMKLTIINYRLSQKTTLLVFWKMRSFVYLFIYTILVTSRLKKGLEFVFVILGNCVPNKKLGERKKRYWVINNTQGKWHYVEGDS